MLDAAGFGLVHSSSATSDPPSETMSLTSAEVSKYRISGVALLPALTLTRWPSPSLAGYAARSGASRARA